MTDSSGHKDRLVARLAELDARLHKIETRLDQPGSKDWEDQAIEREDDEVLEDLGNAGLKEMELIRAALERIEDGSYGICAACGDDIAPERLSVVPHTILCRSCAQKAET